MAVSVGAPTRFKLDKDHTSDMHTTFVSRSACFVRRARFSSQAETTLCVIGAGKMSEAMLGGIQTSRELKISALRVYDPNAKRGELFSSKFGATVAGSLEEALAGSSTIVLSCKPQNLAGVFRAASGHIGDESLVVSIIAGCTIDTLQAVLLQVGKSNFTNLSNLDEISSKFQLISIVVGDFTS